MKKRIYFITVIVFAVLLYGWFKIRQPHIIAYISLSGECNFYPENKLIQYGPPIIIGELSETLQSATMSFAPVLNNETQADILKRMNEAYTSNLPFLFYRHVPRMKAPHTSFFIFVFPEEEIGKTLQVGFGGFQFSFGNDGKERDRCVLSPRKNLKITSRIMSILCIDWEINALAYASPGELLLLLERGNETSDFPDDPLPPQIEEFKLGHSFSRTAIIGRPLCK